MFERILELASVFRSKAYVVSNDRLHKRLRAPYLVRFETAGSSEPPTIANLKDLSASGLRFTSPKFILEGTLLRVSTLVPPLNLTVEALARVVRTRRVGDATFYYIAAVFLEIPREVQLALDQLIEEMASLRRVSNLVDHREHVRREREMETLA